MASMSTTHEIASSDRQQSKLSFLVALSSREDAPITRFRKHVLFDVNVCQIIFDFFCMCAGSRYDKGKCDCRVMVAKSKELSQTYQHVWNLFRDNSLHYSYFIDAYDMSKMDRDLLEFIKGPNQDKPVLKWNDNGSCGETSIFALWNESTGRWRLFVYDDRRGAIMGTTDDGPVRDFSDDFAVESMESSFGDYWPKLTCPSLRRYYKYLDTEVRTCPTPDVRKRKLEQNQSSTEEENPNPSTKRQCIDPLHF